MNKEWLEQKYTIEKLSLAAIAKEANCSAPTIKNYFKKYNIQTRSISDALKGRKLSKEHSEKVKQNIIKANLNKHLNGVSKEEAERLKQIRPNRTGLIHSDETKEKMRQKALGRKNSEEAKRKMSQTRKNNQKYSGENHPLYGVSREDIKGENNPNWNGGVTSIYKQIRESIPYKQWRAACFEKDGYVCQFCGQRGGNLQVDHKKMFSLIVKENNINNLDDANSCKELWDISNGRTLCVTCHKNTDTYGSRPSKKSV